jgi:hypothetical protein
MLATDGLLVPTSATVSGVATHPEDDLVLATAVSTSADYLVTGDNRFVTRAQLFQGVTLMSPRDFMTLLDELRGSGLASASDARCVHPYAPSGALASARVRRAVASTSSHRPMKALYACPSRPVCSS